MLDASIGEYEDAALSVRAPTTGPLEAALDPSSAAVLLDGLSVLRVETTRVAGRTIADPLPPLAEVATVEGGEVARLVLRVRVPDGTAPGVYSGLVQLSLGGAPLRSVPITLRVWDVRQPALDDPNGFRTLFLVNPQTYEHAVTKRTGVSPNTHGAAIIGRLYALLSQYRISPGSWGYGTPFPGGYENRRGWWRRSGSLMAAEGEQPVLDHARAARHAARRGLRAHRHPRDRPRVLGRLPASRRRAVLAGARLARPCGRVGLGRAGKRRGPPLRRPAGVRCAPGRCGVCATS